MIGFKITVTSNTRYSYSNDTIWTEGDFWIADVMSTLSKMPGGGVQGKLIGKRAAAGTDVIEAAFHGMLNGYLAKLSNVGNQIAVQISIPGNDLFNYALFNYKQSGEEMVQVFMQDLARSSDLCNQDVGDQVLIQICKVICEFDIRMPIGMVGQLWIDLEF